MPLRNELKAVALDIDGTLYPESAYRWRMFLSAFPDPLLALAYGRARAFYRRDQERNATVPANRAGYLRRLSCLMLGFLHGKITEESIARMTERVERQMYAGWERTYRSVKPRPGLRDAFLAFKERGWKTAVLSDFPLGPKLHALGIEDLVDAALSSEDTGYLKPDKRVFLSLLFCIDVAPENVLYVGDSYRKDVLGSRASGMQSCLITSDSRKLYPGADLVVTSFPELVSLL